MSHRFVLVDGNALVHAAWHGYPERVGNDGLSYRALHGFFSKIHRLDRDYDWDELLVVFDPPEGSLYRKGLYSEYKAHRPKPDPDLVRQLLLIEEVLVDFGISTLKVPGVETDDVIGTLSKIKAESGSMVMILTPDKDMAQLVNENVGILRPLRGKVAIDTPFDYLSEDGVIDRFGVRASQIADWLALIGDSSDNIPGVEGVGPKKATQLITEYGDLRTLLTNVDKLKGKLKEELLSSRDTMEIVIKLTTIQTDLDTKQWNIREKNSVASKKEKWRLKMGMPDWMGEFSFDSKNVSQESSEGSSDDFDSPF